MPAVMDTTALVAHVETPDRSRDALECRERERLEPAGLVSRPFETPIDHFVQEYPALAMYALALL